MPKWKCAKEPERLRIEVTAQLVVEVTSPLPGVIRVRHAPSAHLSAHGTGALPPKQSAALAGGGAALPLVITEQQDGAVRVEAGGATLTFPPELDDRFGWTFNDGQARCVDVRGDATVGYPVPFYRSDLALRAPEGEAYLGFGEKVGPLDKRGMRFTFWNSDVIPHQPDTDPLYASIPFFLALGRGAAWGMYLDETWRSEVDVAQTAPELVRWTVNGPELDVYLLAGPSPLEVVDRYTALTGRPALPPLWSLGAHQSRWGYESGREVRAIIDAYRAHGLPLDCVHLDIDHPRGLRPLSWDAVRFGEPGALAHDAAQKGVKLVTIVDPAIPKAAGEPLYEDALKGNHVVLDDRGEVLEGEVWPRQCVWPDLTRDEVRRFWSGAHEPLLRAGISGIWNDMNEPSCFSLAEDEKPIGPPPGVDRGLPSTVEGKTLPYDARHGDKRHLEVHNVYALGMAQAAVEAQRTFRPEHRPFVLTRAGFAGIQRYAAMWTGDNSSHWEHLELSLVMLQGLGVSGVPFSGADVPGFLGTPSPELMLRWTQAGIFYPFMRNHSARGTPAKEPWRFGDAWLQPAREVLLRRYRLLPTLYTLMHEASLTGAPALRPLALHWPDDREARWAVDQFLFGPDLLVAPVTRPGQTKRMVYLPAGRWIPFTDLRGQTGHATRDAKVIDGPAHVLADAPVESTPAFLRAGGGIVLTRPALHTTHATWPELDWHLGFAGDIGVGVGIEATLYEDAGDGDGPSRTTTLRAEWDASAGVLRFTRELQGALSVAPRPERIHLHGFPLPAGGSGHAPGDKVTVRAEGGALVLEGQDDWRELEVALRGLT